MFSIGHLQKIIKQCWGSPLHRPPQVVRAEAAGRPRRPPRASQCSRGPSRIRLTDRVHQASENTRWCSATYKVVISPLTSSIYHLPDCTRRCNFSSLTSPDGSAPAALASLLLDPPEFQIIGENTVFRDFPTFSRTCIFFLLTLSLL